MTRRRGLFVSTLFSLDQKWKKARSSRLTSTGVTKGPDYRRRRTVESVARLSLFTLVYRHDGLRRCFSARPALGQRVRASASASPSAAPPWSAPGWWLRLGDAAGLEGITQEKYVPGINMPEGPKDALNKWSRKITQPKSQGASQVSATPIQPTPDRIAPRRLTDKSNRP